MQPLKSFKIFKKRFTAGPWNGGLIKLVVHQSIGCSSTDQWKQSLDNLSVILLRTAAWSPLIEISLRID